MEHLRQLLIALVALTLVLSVASVANPNYFAGLNVYADHDEDEDDDNNINSGSGKSDEEHDEEDDEDERDEDDDDEGDEDDDNSGKGSNNKSKDRDDDEDDDDKLVQTLGNHSKAVLEIDEGDLEVEIDDGDLEDGTYDVVFECTNPGIKKEFVHSLTVDGEEGEFEVELMLANGTYSGCKVDVGGLSATFSSFSIKPEEDKDEAEDEDEKDDDEEHEEEDNEHEDDNERNEKFKSKLKTEDEGIEIEVEVEGINMTSGSYDAIFACEVPSFNVTLNNAFEVHSGKGKLKETVGLANDTYSGCDITAGGTVLASFNTFTVSEETKEEQERKVEVKREEKKQRIVSTTTGHEIHEKHRKASPASPGDYDPGWNYTLSADGSAMSSDENSIVGSVANATVNIDMAVWKSTSAIILLDVLNGTIELDDHQYTVKVGYVIYSTNHGAMKVAALAVDDDGNIVKLRLLGSAAVEGVQFPTESGSIDLIFEGSVHQSGGMADRDLVLDGNVTAT